MICMKKLPFSSRPRAKVRRQGLLGSAREQPCKSINELFIQKKNTSYKKNILQNNKQNVYTHTGMLVC